MSELDLLIIVTKTVELEPISTVNYLFSIESAFAFYRSELTSILGSFILRPIITPIIRS